MNVAAECTYLAHAIAPETKNDPFYVVDSADLATIRQEPTHCYGYASTGAPDVGIRDYLVSVDRWQGPGRSIVLCCDLIRKDAGDNYRQALLETFIHELAHAIIAPIPQRDVAPSPLTRVIEDRCHKAFLSATFVSPENEDHGGPFVRRCLHLWQRSLWAGFYAEPWRLCAGNHNYGMSDARSYLEALGDEPYRLAKEPFSLIEEIPQPAKFALLWAKDLARLQEQPV